jgi:hypothetical protein
VPEQGVHGCCGVVVAVGEHLDAPEHGADSHDGRADGAEEEVESVLCRPQRGALCPHAPPCSCCWNLEKSYPCWLVANGAQVVWRRMLPSEDVFIGACTPQQLASTQKDPPHIGKLWENNFTINIRVTDILHSTSRYFMHKSCMHAPVWA